MYLNLALSYSEIGDNEKAAEYYEVAVNKNSKLKTAKYAYLKKGKLTAQQSNTRASNAGDNSALTEPAWVE